MTLEVVIEGLRVFFLFARYAVEELQKHEAAKLDDQQKRAAFDAALSRVATDMQRKAVEEKAQVDKVDDAVDAAASSEPRFSKIEDGKKFVSDDGDHWVEVLPTAPVPH